MRFLLPTIHQTLIVLIVNKRALQQIGFANIFKRFDRGPQKGVS